MPEPVRAKPEPSPATPEGIHPKPEPLHAALYRVVPRGSTHIDGVPADVYHKFYIGTRAELKRIPPEVKRAGGVLVDIKPLLARDARILAPHVNGVLKSGIISYLLTPSYPGIAARGDPYDPKGNLPVSVPRFGYFLEAMAVTDLDSLGATHVWTSQTPSQSRRDQLERVGLPVGRQTPIREWRAGLLKGVRLKPSGKRL